MAFRLLTKGATGKHYPLLKQHRPLFGLRAQWKCIDSMNRFIYTAAAVARPAIITSRQALGAAA